MSKNKGVTFLPLLPLKNVVALPKSIIPVIVGREVSIKAVERALAEDKQIFVTAQKVADVATPTEKDVFIHGIRATILQASRLDNGTYKIFIEGSCRAKVTEFRTTDLGFIEVDIEDLPVKPLKNTAESEALWRTLHGLFKEYVALNTKISGDVLSMFHGPEDLDYLADTVAVHVQLKLKERQLFLETIDLKDRVNKIIKLLKREIEIVKTEQKIRKRVQTQVEKHQKDYYLAEQMRAIQHELGRDNIQEELDKLRNKAKKLKLPKDAHEKVEAEIKRLEQMQPTSPEATVSRNYVDWILALPWGKKSEDLVKLSEADEILDSSHAGMKKAKERILEFIATKKYAGNKLKKAPIICLAGPPGVGKTSLAVSIAKALGREFVRISLGGMRDEAEIRGHRRTYIGAMPGKIIQGMKKAKTINPVILLDEIDKMSMDFRGDPASALLEVLDPEHNNTFADYFLDTEYDLSNVFFITTANVIDNVPYPLFDRMEVINLSGYTLQEKLEIGKDFLLPKLLMEHGVKKNLIKISNSILIKVIDEYTKEAGVRQLERLLAKIIRKSIEILLSNGKKSSSVIVDDEKIQKWLGYSRYKKPDNKIEKKIGVATGLAWTEVGGDVLEIEVTILKGKGSLSLTGQLGEVMQESAQAALSYIRSRAKDFGLKENFYADCDIHVHIPEGAIQKDGPSAGITMTAALTSALTKINIKPAVAMSGEVTLTGRVLAVGGLKEKLLAATRFGAKTVVVPKENEDEIKEFEKELDPSLKIVYANNMDQVLDQVLDKTPFRKRKRSL
ncbi:endopeptidase La [Candidatus Babeliales bacterium]|nr:endopeptidase La [Candidatus Babeliales bacterium]